MSRSRRRGRYLCVKAYYDSIMRVELPVMSAFFINEREKLIESRRKRKLKNAEAKKNLETQKLRNGEIRGPSAYALRDSGGTGEVTNRE